MRYKGHLVLSGVINTIFLFALYKAFSVNIFQIGLVIPLAITFYLFSILPDIDHSSSRVSKLLNLFLVFLFGFFVYNFYRFSDSVNLLKVALVIGIFVVHTRYARNSYLHRRFPHTFTFGVIACAILYFLTNSIIITAVGVISFFTHILGDGHFVRAIKRDKRIWKS